MDAQAYPTIKFLLRCFLTGNQNILKISHILIGKKKKVLILIYSENVGFFPQNVVRSILRMNTYMTKFCANPHSFVDFVISPLKTRFLMEIVIPLSTALENELQS